MQTPSDYVSDIVAIVAPAATSELSFLDIPMAAFEELSAKYDRDALEVLEDAMQAYGEIKIALQIESGHACHVEEKPARPMSELIGFGMITEGTDLMIVDDFVELVRYGHVSDRDGYGEFVSGTGEEFLPIRCNVAWLEEFRDEWPYIAWYRS